MLTAEAPRGFRPSGTSGLMVPMGLDRQRQTWTKDEWKLIERTVKLLKARGVKVTMSCALPACTGEIIRVDDVDPILRCNCTDRVFTRAF